MQTLTQLRPWVNGASKRMPRPVGTPAPLPMSELKIMYARRARYNTQMAAKARVESTLSWPARRVSWNSEVSNG